MGEDPQSGWTGPDRGERYQAQPGLAALPGRVWRRLPRAGRVLVVLLPVAAVALALALAPGIDESKEERARAEQQRLERKRSARAERIREQQQPRFASVRAPARGSIPARERVVASAAGAVRADARERVTGGELDGPIRRVACEPFPRTVTGVGAEQDPARRFGTYSCLAVTTAFGPNTGGDTESYAQSEAGLIGHPYRMRLDFETGRYAFCKISGRAGEGSIGAQPVVTVPRACGGR